MSTLDSRGALALLEQATLVAAGTLSGDETLLDLEGWDSMGMVMFIGLVQEQAGFELSVADLRGQARARDLAELVAARAAAAATGGGPLDLEPGGRR